MVNIKREFKERHRMKKKAEIAKMHMDVLNGAPKSLVKERYFNGEYIDEVADLNDNAKHKRFQRAWDAMIDEFGKDFEENKNDLKSKFLAKYNYLYQLAIDKGNIKEARQILDSLRDMTGADEPTKVDLNVDGVVHIEFDTD